jgi:HAD superfamily hydrolase (TIGR01548 family)
LKKSSAKRNVELLVFDVDGVLVDVSGSFHRSTIQTVRHFTGRAVTASQIQEWKSKGGYNDDWRLTTDWIAQFGGSANYEAVKRQFMEFYWGDREKKNFGGNVLREKWLISRTILRRWSRRCELALFTGRTRNELEFTLARAKAGGVFKQIVTMDDINKLKPHPDGLIRILAGRDPWKALYLGDNVDDALASRRAGVPFLGVLPRNSNSRRLRGERLRELGAMDILHNVREAEKWL